MVGRKRASTSTREVRGERESEREGEEVAGKTKKERRVQLNCTKGW